jgi:hypothetical protein
MQERRLAILCRRPFILRAGDLFLFMVSFEPGYYRIVAKKGNELAIFRKALRKYPVKDVFFRALDWPSEWLCGI